MSARTYNTLVDCAQEKVVEQKIRKFGIAIERLFDAAEEARANNAAAAPHQADRAHIERPSALLAGCTQQHEALRVADDFRCVKRVFNVLEKRATIFDEFVRILDCRWNDFRRVYALSF